MSRREDEANAATLPASDPGATATAASMAEVSGATLPDTQAAPPRGGDELANPLQAGDKLGRYLLGARLGAGAMGVVWSAQDPRLDRRIAIKVVHPRLARTAEASGRLLREARAMAKVSHRAVVTVHDAGEVDGRLYVAMELVEGTTLGQLLRERTASDLADWRRWLELVIDAGRGLAAAHRGGVLHRDFKPDNVLVDRDGRVCVADFGLASLGQDADPAVKAARDSIPLDLTATGSLLGTPIYMSPQQLRGEPVDERADQFAFCVTAWEALYGKRPFTTDQTGIAAIADLASTIETTGVTLPPASSPVPASVLDVLVRGLAAEPERRWPTMDALVAALAGALEQSGLPARRRAARRRRAMLPWLVLVMFVVATGSALAIWKSRGAPASTPLARAATPNAAKKLFAVALRTRVALSADGKRVALGGARLEVRDVDGVGYWSTALSDLGELTAIEVDDELVYFGHKHERGIFTWRYRTDPAPTRLIEGPEGQWYGRTIKGHVMFTPGPRPAIRIIDGTTEVARWDVNREVEMLRVSPSGKRIAYFDGRRFAQRLVIRDLVSGRQLSIGPDAAFTALAWRSDDAILYATGTVDRPRIYQVAVGSGGVSPSTLIHELETGWIASLAATRDQVLYVEMGLSSRARVLARPGFSARDYDSAAVAAPLTWTSTDEFLAWNRSSRRVDRHALNGLLGATNVVLASEPANATFVGDLLITSLRGNEGRKTIAVSLATGKPVWEHADLRTFVVRCAGDRNAPCYAVVVGDLTDQIKEIDPATGTLGKVIYEGQQLEDIAVSTTGTHVLVATTAHADIVNIDVTNPSATTRRTVPMTATRSVAFDLDGGVLATGTISRNTYQAGRLGLDGTFDVVSQTENDILSMIRPSPDGRRLLLLSRSYAPMLWQVGAANR